MTSSLVGSEMCIRDRMCAAGLKDPKTNTYWKKATEIWHQMKDCYKTSAVSYTHLTLPTICSV
eukprot:4214382-Prorocentrum_lima.AAC.1